MHLNYGNCRRLSRNATQSLQNRIDTRKFASCLDLCFISSFQLFISKTQVCFPFLVDWVKVVLLSPWFLLVQSRQLVDEIKRGSRGRHASDRAEPKLWVRQARILAQNFWKLSKSEVEDGRGRPIGRPASVSGKMNEGDCGEFIWLGNEIKDRSPGFPGLCSVYLPRWETAYTPKTKYKVWKEYWCDLFLSYACESSAFATGAWQKMCFCTSSKSQDIEKLFFQLSA